MLFLAVFCGFLAEYKLEHTIEHQREKKYIHSLVIDVSLDSASLNIIFNKRVQRTIMLDSLTYLLNNPSGNQGTQDLYYYSRYLQRIFQISFTYNDRTIQQLKNSGGLRLIKNKRAADSIIIYDARIRDLLQLEERENTFVDNCLQVGNKIFNGLVYDGMVKSDLTIIKPTSNPPLLKTASRFLDEFNSSLHTVKTTNLSMQIRTTQIMKAAVNLLNTLKDEYNLK